MSQVPPARSGRGGPGPSEGMRRRLKNQLDGVTCAEDSDVPEGLSQSELKPGNLPEGKGPKLWLAPTDLGRDAPISPSSICSAAE